MSDLPLLGLTILDMSYRLPGPFGTKVLSELGAKVLKVEDINFKDPFLTTPLAEIDPVFSKWYNHLNQKKQIMRFDFSKQSTNDDLKDLISQSDVLVMGLPKKIQTKLNLTQTKLKNIKRPLAVIEILASQTTRPVHDLNAMAESDLLSLYTANKDESILPPPFLPIAGLSFGQQIATEVLAQYILSQKSKTLNWHQIFLLDTIKSLLSPLWPKEEKSNQKTTFLHNGKFPCYSLYRTKDHHYIALAAIEKKYWIKFCQCFNLAHLNELQFSIQDNTVFKELSNVFLNMTASEVKNKTDRNDFCLSIVYPASSFSANNSQ